MKFRIFYAPQVFLTWEKLFVLTSDGKLYCKYFMLPNYNIIEEQGFNYETSSYKMFMWGKGVFGEKSREGLAEGATSNYHKCDKELTWQEYLDLNPSALLKSYPDCISGQIHWLQNYISTLGLTSADWDSGIYEKHKSTPEMQH